MTKPRSVVSDIYALKKGGADVTIYERESSLKYSNNNIGAIVHYDRRSKKDEHGIYEVYPFAKSGSNYFVICPFCGEVHAHDCLGRVPSQCIHKAGYDENGMVIWSRDNSNSFDRWYTLKKPSKPKKRRRSKNAKSNMHAKNKV